MSVTADTHHKSPLNEENSDFLMDWHTAKFFPTHISCVSPQ